MMDLDGAAEAAPLQNAAECDFFRSLPGRVHRRARFCVRKRVTRGLINGWGGKFEFPQGLKPRIYGL